MSKERYVSYWIERAEHSVAAWEAGDRIHAASGLLACWKALGRVAPSLDARLPALMLRVGRVVDRDGSALAAAVSEHVTAANWMKSFEEHRDLSLRLGTEPVAVEQGALSLVRDLDDGELLLCAFDSLCAQDPSAYPVDLATALTHCAVAAEDEPDLLVAAAEWSQAALQCAPSDLVRRDAELAATLDKHATVVRELEDAQHALATPPVLSRRFVEEAARRSSIVDRLQALLDKVGEAGRRLLLPGHQPVYALGDVGVEGPRSELWRGEPGWQAMILIPAPRDASDHSHVEVTVVDAPDGTTELALCGLFATLEPVEGGYLQARFPLGALRAALDELDVPVLALIAESGDVRVGVREG